MSKEHVQVVLILLIIASLIFIPIIICVLLLFKKRKRFKKPNPNLLKEIQLTNERVKNIYTEDSKKRPESFCGIFTIYIGARGKNWTNDFFKPVLVIKTYDISTEIKLIKEKVDQVINFDIKEIENFYKKMAFFLKYHKLTTNNIKYIQNHNINKSAPTEFIDKKLEETINYYKSSEHGFNPLDNIEDIYAY
ncbi:hypothetical protein [Mesoplasma corruscae]|uniref:Uncharacterized protein n=1 Tax=Mesoplasma corruscae TaxID=216874 RepID=A0A2S5RHN0_9MOLU|nr:hypothetical protein [Mesoplasma corruscae]PPE06836.1 hypothetical protein MCORR_v1c04670 [Mesoplasma corruscae]